MVVPGLLGWRLARASGAVADGRRSGFGGKSAGLCRGLIPLALAFLLLFSGLVPFGRGDTTCVYRIQMPDALPVCVTSREGRSVERYPLSIDIAVRSGVCDRVVWAFTPYLPGIEHTGEVTAYSLDEERVAFAVRLDIISNRSGPTFLGGTASYDVDLVVSGSVVEGTYRGVCASLADKAELARLEARFGFGPDQPDPDAPQRRALRSVLQGELCATNTSGNVGARVIDAPEQPAGFRMPEPGEHPRLLFRRSDLPRLKAYAATDEGAKRVREIEQMLAQPGGRALGQVSDPAVEGASHAFLYQMTGNKAHAEAAANLVRWALFSRYEPGAFWRHAYTLVGVGLAYDMCGDTWSVSDRRFVYAYLEEYTRLFAQRHDQADILNTDDHFMFANPREGFIYDEGAWDAVQSRIGAVVGSLAILNDPPEYVAPPDEIARLAPMEGFSPWYGVPVVPFESDLMPREWLINGPFLRDEVDGAVREQMGGYEAMRPEPGIAMKVEGESLVWRPYRPTGHNSPSPRLDVRHCGRYFGAGYTAGHAPSARVIEKWKQRFAGGQIPMSVLLHTVITNDVERIIEALPNWRSPSLSSRMWINGRPVEDGVLFHIRPGLYTLTAEVPIYGSSSFQSPKLREFDRDMLRVARAVAGNAKALAGPSVAENRVLRNAIAMRRSVERWMQHNLNQDGWEPRGYTLLAPMVFVHRNVMGFDLAGSDGLTRSLQWALRLRGHTPGAMAYDVISTSYGVMSPAIQPYALWCMDRRKEQTARGSLDAILAFVTMPPDAARASPDGVFDLAHHFDDSGRYVFNSGFEGEESLVAVVSTGASRGGGRDAVGGIAFSGLGGTWLGWRLPEPVWDREFTGLIPIELFPGGAAKIVHEGSDADGARVLTIRQHVFVRGSVRSWVEKDKETTQVHRDVRIGRAPVPGAYAVRSVGVDFSGKSGAPMLVAVADRMQLVRKREVAWRLTLGSAGMPRIRAGPRTDERAAERGFRLAGATGTGLQVTYVAPRDFEFRTQNDAEVFQGGVVDAVVFRRSTIEEQAARRSALVSKDAGRIQETSRLGSRDEVDDHGARPVNVMELADNLLEEIKEGEEGVPAPITFLVVMTLQRGAAPAVETLATGEFPAARVGKRLVRFDGTNVVFGVETAEGR